MVSRRKIKIRKVPLHLSPNLSLSVLPVTQSSTIILVRLVHFISLYHLRDFASSLYYLPPHLKYLIIEKCPEGELTSLQTAEGAM